MSPTPLPEGAGPSADELNAQIRALWIDGRGHPAVGLSDAQREEYRRLLAQLREVERGDVTEAA